VSVSGPSVSGGDPRPLLRAGFAGAVALPLVVTTVLLALPGPSPWWRSFDAGLWAAFVGVFGAVGAMLSVAWALECRVAVVVGLVVPIGAAAWPTLGFGEVPDAVSTLVGTAVVGVPALVLGVSLEYAARRSDRRLRPTRVEGVALVVGVVHLLAIDCLTATLEHRPFLPRPTEVVHVDVAGMALLAVVVGGAILLGGVPVVLGRRCRLVVPAGFVLLAFGWATYRTWLRSLGTLPPEGPGFGISPTPLTLYLWGGSLLVVAAMLLGGLEYTLRRRLGIAPPPAPWPDPPGGEEPRES